MPWMWKLSYIKPIPKKKKAIELNDFRPISLTCSVMKCFERVILKHLLNYSSSHIDPLQFAYRSKRGVEDAVLLYLHKMYSHLDKSKTYVRSTFVDFSSAFNTIVTHLLTKKLMSFNVPPHIILWIHDFLSNRPQKVIMGNVQSSVKVLNTGAPQGCVLSPVLFSLYTSNCRCTLSECSIIKYADDTVITGYLRSDNIESYTTTIKKFVKWCDDHFLLLNVSKTKELIVDFRRNAVDHRSVSIHGEEVEQVTEYKYLGTTISNTLNWSKNVGSLQKRANQRLYFVRTLKKLRVDNTLLVLFYKSLIQSVLAYNIVCYFANATQIDLKKLNQPRKTVQRMLGIDLPSLNDLYTERVYSKLRQVLQDPTHPLNENFNMNRSGIRLCAPRTQKTRFRQSFVPNSIHLFNAQVRRSVSQM